MFEEVIYIVDQAAFMAIPAAFALEHAWPLSQRPSLRRIRKKILQLATKYAAS